MPLPLPISLNLTARRCAVIGTGALAEEKAAALAEAGAEVVVFESVEGTRFEGVFLAVSALNDTHANAQLRERARKAGTLFNALDDPPNCDFYFPAVHRQGELTIALSTNGQCPALSVRLKQQFESLYGPEYASFIAIAREVRPRIRHADIPFSERRALWYRLVDSDAIALLKQNRETDARALIETLLREAGL